MGTAKYIMKFLVLASCLSLSAAQGFFGLQGHPNGAVTPIDEPRVAALKADHLATKFGAGPVVAAGPVAHVGYAAAPAYAPAYGYAGPLNLNTHLVAHPNGAVVPVDEPAVAAARADHFAAQGASLAAAAPIAAVPVAPLPQLLTATPAPSTSTPTSSPTPMVPSSPLMSPPLLLPVPTTSPPRVPSTRERLERTHVSHFGVFIP